MPAGPGGSGGQGRYRPGRPQVGRPRDLDGRPRGEGERRGGRTFRPGLHDWTPGAASGTTGAAGATGSTGSSNDGRSNGGARPRPAYRPQGAPGGAAQRQRPPERRVFRPGSMGPGAPAGPADSAAPSGERAAERGAPAPGRSGPPRWNRNAAPPGSFRAAPGVNGGRTRLGSDEPRDAGDRSRYRLRSTGGFADERGDRGSRGNGAVQGGSPRFRPPYADGAPRSPAGPQRGRPGTGPRARFEGASGPRRGPGRSGYADLDHFDEPSAARTSGNDFPFPAVSEHDESDFNAAPPSVQPAEAGSTAESEPSGQGAPARAVEHRPRSPEPPASAAGSASASAPARRRRRAAGD